MVLTYSVLCVDDEAPLREICKQYLERTKECTITTASSAPAALQLLKSNGVQAIVSDYQMPGMDGIAFFKAGPGNGARFEMVVPPGGYRGAGAQPPR